MEGMGIGSHPGSTYGQVKIELLCIERFEWMDPIDAGARHAHGGRLYGGWWHAPATARQQSGSALFQFWKQRVRQMWVRPQNKFAFTPSLSGCGMVWHWPIEYAAPVSKTWYIAVSKKCYLSDIFVLWTVKRFKLNFSVEKSKFAPIMLLYRFFL